jgi:hypothetical protein
LLRLDLQKLHPVIAPKNVRHEKIEAMGSGVLEL